jgi:hypothetical protein
MGSILKSGIIQISVIEIKPGVTRSVRANRTEEETQ